MTKEPAFFYVDNICYQFVGLEKVYPQNRYGGVLRIDISGRKIKLSGRLSLVNYVFRLEQLSIESQPDYKALISQARRLGKEHDNT